jgi:hypothetical protein
MSEITFNPLSGRGQPIKAKRVESGWLLSWGNCRFEITDCMLAEILGDFFVDPNHWYPLGASMTEPMPNGLGFFLRHRYPKFTSRHASPIAALMVKQKLIECRGAKPIELRRKRSLSTSTD